MGIKRTLVSALLLVTGAVLAVGTASADRPGGTAAGHIRGVVAPQTTGEGPQASTGNLTWHGGPVMHSSSVYAIYWAPSGYTY